MVNDGCMTLPMRSMHPLWVLPAFFLLNSSLNILNRWTLGVAGFRFPLILTTCHAVLACALITPGVVLAGRCESFLRTAQKGWKGIAAVCYLKITTQLCVRTWGHWPAAPRLQLLIAVLRRLASSARSTSPSTTFPWCTSPFLSIK